MENGDLAPVAREIAITTRLDGTPLEERIKEAYATDPAARTISEQFKKTPNGLLTHEGRVYLPLMLREDVIREQHALPAHGHQGERRTYSRLARQFWCPGMRKIVKLVVGNCDTCARNKASRHAPYGRMGTVPIPEEPWKSISWDFIVKLPGSKDPATKTEYDSILVVMERLTKYMVLVPYQEANSAEQLAYTFMREISSQHGLPEEILSDRDTRFTSKFWTALTAMLGVRRKLTTSFHPQTNGGNERMNQIVETYLRCYVNYQQTNWVEMLPLAQFSYNSSTTETTETTPFFANYGYDPVMYREPGITDVDNQLARIHVSKLKELHSQLAEDLRFFSERNAHYYDKRHSQEPALKEGDRVYLIRKNIATKRPSDKLDWKKLGPYEIKSKRGTLNYELKLPKNMHIHPVFHVSLLEPAPPGAPPAPNVEIEPVNPEEDYDVEDILDCKLVRGKTKYLVKWLDYPHSENTWEFKTDLSCPEKLLEFHRQNPDLPRRGPKGSGRRGRRVATRGR